jgi:hypothetical protein
MQPAKGSGPVLSPLLPGIPGGTLGEARAKPDATAKRGPSKVSGVTRKMKDAAASIPGLPSKAWSYVAGAVNEHSTVISSTTF